MNEKSDYGWAALIGIPFGIALSFAFRYFKLPQLAYIGYIFAGIGVCAGIAWSWHFLSGAFRKK